MPSFDTPQPIEVTLELESGDVRLTASERSDTVVEVRPGNPARAIDVETAEQTRVEYRDGRLSIKTPRSRGHFGRGGSVDVTIALPAGSRLHGNLAAGDLQGQGRLGECRFATASGDVRLEETGSLRLEAGSGDITVERAAGDVEIACASGDVRIREIEGAAAMKNANGASLVGEIRGDLHVRAASGDISVGRALAGVTVRSASGDVQLGEVGRGRVTLDTASGDIAVGIRAGSAAWLDLSTVSGDVRNTLETVDGPDATDETVEVRARSASGDIVIRRAEAVVLV